MHETRRAWRHHVQGCVNVLGVLSHVQHHSFTERRRPTAPEASRAVRHLRNQRGRQLSSQLFFIY